MSRQGARCMDCGIPFCQTRLPGQQHHPGLERPRVPQQLARGARRAALDQQLPRVHRPRLPGALRGGLHAQHQRRPGDHQVDRARHRRQGLGRGLDRARSLPHRKTGQARRRGGLGPRGARLRAAARARRPRRGALREERPHRRPAPLRHPRFQDGEAPHRPAHGADARRGRDVPDRRPRRRALPVRSSCSTSSTRWCSPAAPSSRASSPVPGRELDGIHFAMEFLPQQNKRVAGDEVAGPDPRHRQARGGDRRRRHRLRLHRHLDPPGRGVGHELRAHAAAPRRTRTSRSPGRTGR